MNSLELSLHNICITSASIWDRLVQRGPRKRSPSPSTPCLLSRWNGIIFNIWLNALHCCSLLPIRGRANMYQTLKARYWPWLSGRILTTFWLVSPLLGSGYQVRLIPTCEAQSCPSIRQHGSCNSVSSNPTFTPQPWRSIPCTLDIYINFSGQANSLVQK